MNNKGFMMAEVVVVSAVILVALSVFYVNYNKLISLYNERLTYYDPATLYSLADFRNKNCLGATNNCAVPNTNIFNILAGADNGTGETTYIVNGGSLSYFLSSIEYRANNTPTGHNKTFVSYLKYLIGSLDSSAKSNYLLIRESCNGRTDCKYAYLEVLVRA